MANKAKETAKAKKSPVAHKKSPLIDYSKPLKNTHHERFSQEYHKSLNATDAYKIAYPKSSQKAAEANGIRLIGTDRVRGRIEYLQSLLSDTCGVTAKRLMEEWKKIGFANIKNCVKVDNTISDISKLPDEVSAAIDSISTSRNAHGRTVKLTFHSKTKALEDMGKMIGAYGKDNEQRGIMLYNPELK